MSVFKFLKEAEPCKYPNRMGQPWTDEETLKLLKSIRNKESIEKIAQNHERTEGAITSRQRSLAADYYFNDNKPLEEICKIVGLDKETVAFAISKRQNRENIKKNVEKNREIVENNSESELISIMREILSKLNEIKEILENKT